MEAEDNPKPELNTAEPDNIPQPEKPTEGAKGETSEASQSGEASVECETPAEQNALSPDEIKCDQAEQTNLPVDQTESTEPETTETSTAEIDPPAQTSKTTEGGVTKPPDICDATPQQDEKITRDDAAKENVPQSNGEPGNTCSDDIATETTTDISKKAEDVEIPKQKSTSVDEQAPKQEELLSAESEPSVETQQVAPIDDPKLTVAEQPSSDLSPQESAQVIETKPPASDITSAETVEANTSQSDIPESEAATDQQMHETNTERQEKNNVTNIEPLEAQSLDNQTETPQKQPADERPLSPSKSERPLSPSKRSKKEIPKAEFWSLPQKDASSIDDEGKTRKSLKSADSDEDTKTDAQQSPAIETKEQPSIPVGEKQPDGDKEHVQQPKDIVTEPNKDADLETAKSELEAPASVVEPANPQSGVGSDNLEQTESAPAIEKETVNSQEGSSIIAADLTPEAAIEPIHTQSQDGTSATNKEQEVKASKPAGDVTSESKSLPADSNVVEGGAVEAADESGFSKFNDTTADKKDNTNVELDKIVPSTLEESPKSLDASVSPSVIPKDVTEEVPASVQDTKPVEEPVALTSDKGALPTDSDVRCDSNEGALKDAVSSESVEASVQKNSTETKEIPPPSTESPPKSPTKKTGSKIPQLASKPGIKKPVDSTKPKSPTSESTESLKDTKSSKKKDKAKVDTELSVRPKTSSGKIPVPIALKKNLDALDDVYHNKPVSSELEKEEMKPSKAIAVAKDDKPTKLKLEEEIEAYKPYTPLLYREDEESSSLDEEDQSYSFRRRDHDAYLEDIEFSPAYGSVEYYEQRKAKRKTAAELIREQQQLMNSLYDMKMNMRREERELSRIRNQCFYAEHGISLSGDLYDDDYD